MPRQVQGGVVEFARVLRVRRLDEAGIRSLAIPLAALLKDAVDGDAGLGFVAPLDPEVAHRYWALVADEVARGARVVLVAERDGEVVGSAQLDLCARPNGLHRAEVQKVMVRSTARRQGVGLLLMSAIEDEARAEGRTTLHLDTFEGDAGEALYQKAGWTRSGRIPEFARRADGALDATVIYHKLLRRG